MNIIDTTKKCVGCGACADICPVKAIRLNRNADGFYEAEFANDACVNCGKCLEVCPALNLETGRRDAKFYYGWTKDADVREKSSSGGAFTALAQQVLSEDGVVFGARYSDDFKSVLMSSTEECSLEALRRSKYCQTISNEIYDKISKQLKNGKKVMMVGTPCQIAAARRCFGNHENVILVDFLCGGVIPDKTLENYVSYIESKRGSKIKNINMRDKSRGWSKPGIRIELENGKVYSSRYQFDYYHHYYYCTPYLKNTPCLTCDFTEHNDADITIADFWGYEKAKVTNDDKGISLICVYTEKGQKYLDSIENEMNLYPLDASYTEYAYKEKSHKPEALEERKRFLEMVRESSFIEAAKKHHFKYGRAGVLFKIILRKVVRK